MSTEELKGVARSALAPALAACASNPMDVLKTRMNMDSEMGATRRYTSMWDCARQTYAAEGLEGLQRGLRFAMVREASKCMFRIGLYDPIVTRLHGSKAGAPPMWKRFLAGASSGAIAAVVCNPLDLLKTRLQLEASHASGLTVNASVITVARQLVRAEGWKALWRGTPTSTLRSVISTGSTLPVMSWCKERYPERLPTGAVKDAVCAMIASVVLIACMNPVDVVRLPLRSSACKHPPMPTALVLMPPHTPGRCARGFIRSPPAALGSIPGPPIAR